MSSRLERILYIDHCIRQKQPFSARSLAEDLEVSPRSIESDLAYLRDRFGAPLHHDREAGTYTYDDPNFRLPTIDLNDREILALLLGQRVLEKAAGNALGPTFRMAVAKIQERSKAKASAIPIESLWFGGEQGPELPSKLFRDLLNAVEQLRAVSLVYFAASTDKLTDRTVEPYGLYLHRDTWYLIAFCRLRQDFRYFHLARIRDWDVLDEHFARRGDFDMASYLHRAFQLEQGGEPIEAIIRFRQPSARYIRERRWHPDQRQVAFPDGSIELHFPAASVREVTQWVLGYGAGAEVVGPEALREAVVAQINAMSQVYQGRLRS